MNLLLSRLKLLLFAKANFVFHLLGIFFLVLTYKPYCSENTNGSIFQKICVPCPENSICSFRKVISCSLGYQFRPENEICIRDDKRSLEAHQLSLRAQRFIEERSFRHECIGDKTIPSLIDEDQLFEYTISQSTGSESYLNKLFDEMLSLMMSYPKVYQVAADASQKYYSFKFQSFGACLLNTYQFNTESDPSHKTKATLISRIKASSGSVTQTPTVISAKLQTLEQEKKELNNQLKQTKSDMDKLERERILLDHQLKQDKSEKDKLIKETYALKIELDKVVKVSGDESSRAEELRKELAKMEQEHAALIEEERLKYISKQQALENEIKQLKELKAKLEADMKMKKEADDYF